MCGIAGFKGNSSNLHQQQLERMTQALAHRGPDAAGYHYGAEDGIGLGHRRLSIIDLSTEANQPFYSDDRRYVMVFNGEVYNFRELQRRHLSHLAQRTHSDTEIILQLYIEKGPSCLSLFNGMFTLAIWDQQEKTLFLGRDRMGIKPLYYHWDGKDLLFASELKALLAEQPSIAGTYDRQALAHYLHLGYIPRPHTLYHNIRKFPQGYWALLRHGELNLQRWWDPAGLIQPQPVASEQAALAELRQLTEDAVALRMISDVPFGTFLSGGIDSSLVTAIARQKASGPLKTFSIGFRSARHNEAPYARKVAEYLGTEHTEFTVDETNALELIPQLPSIYDEPFADSSAIPSLMVSLLARKHVKMVLTGDGGDELFMGYGAYTWAKRLAHPLYWQLRYPLSGMLRMGDLKSQRAGLVFRVPDKERMAAHIFSQEQYLFSAAEVKSLLGEPPPLLPAELPATRTFTPEETQAWFDLHYYLPDDLLVKVDRATMHHALEARVPLLDYRIVSFALNLHHTLKKNKQGDKYLLKQLLYQYIPQEYFNRPKQGFSIPLHAWMQNELRPLLKEYLSPEAVRATGLLNPQAVNQLMLGYMDGKSYLYNRVWTLLQLQLFLHRPGV